MSEQIKSAPVTATEADRINNSYAEAQSAIDNGNFQGPENSATDNLHDAQRLQGGIEKGREAISSDKIAEVGERSGQLVVAMTIPEGHPAHSNMFDTMESTTREMGHRQDAENFTKATDKAQENGASQEAVNANRGAASRASALAEREVRVR